ncbi:SIR2 family protein [Myxococcus xanthus]|uniref:SIR2 family NAD-dependent protein deacylase n=1 Tax=Myxococcus xanthus TaxID=34 RepID=UPI001916E38D|nr:SIR2 family protein [Myxococcus xanthus]QQR43396.1 SIR2 family protein [Myxococcus xanthus]
MKLAREEVGGALVFGCGLSGRYEISQHAALELSRNNKHWVTLDVATAPRTPKRFLIALTSRIFKQLKLVARQDATDLLWLIRNEKSLFLQQELVKDALRELSPSDRPILFFRNLDAVETSHQQLDSIFEALRDILLETGIYCFVTSTKDIRRSSVGVSHFANNFTTLRPHPVTVEEVATAWGNDRWLPPDVAARAMVKEYGFAERRVRKAMQVLQVLEGNSIGWADRLKANACSDFPRDAEKFYVQLDQSSRQVLKNSLRGKESAPEHVQLIMRHDWARYMLRAVSDESVEIYDSPLLVYVKEEVLKESASRVVESAAKSFDRAPQRRSGSFSSAGSESAELNASLSLTSPPSSRPPMDSLLPKIVHDAYRTNTLAVCAGSGLSLSRDVQGNFPTWQQLPMRLLDACDRLDVLDAKTIQNKREFFKNCMRLESMLAELGSLRTALDRDYQKALNEIFRPVNSAPGLVHRVLCRLGVRALLTTNYDLLIEEVGEVPRRQVYTWNNADLALNDLQSERKILFKVHGTAERHDTVIMTEREYHEARSHQSYRAVFSHLLQGYTFLFLGYGMNDPLDLDLVLKWNADAFKSSARRHYALMKDLSENERDRYVRDYNVRIISYENHSQLPDILEELIAAQSREGTSFKQ